LGKELDRLAMADATSVSAATPILAHYHPELSNPGVDLSAMRIWEVLVFRCRPGHENDFMEAAKLYKTTFEQEKIDVRWATYAVMAGMPGHTFLVFIPHVDLTKLDPASPTSVAAEKAFAEELVFLVNPR
jgi:hypothetical protein